MVKKRKPAKTKRLRTTLERLIAWLQMDQFKRELFKYSHGNENGSSWFARVISNNGYEDRRGDTNRERKLENESVVVLRLWDVFQLQRIRLLDKYEIVMLR